MRRLIAYITTIIAMILAIGVGATPVISKLNAGREFTSGRDYREIVFNVGEGSADKDNDNRASIVADQMRDRLKNYHVEDYSISIQGEDTVAVALQMSSKEFNYVAKYLAFSGGNFALVTSKSVREGHTIFNPDDVRIEYKGDAKVPVVVIPVTDEGKQDVKDLCKEFEDDGSKALIKRSAPVRVDADESDDTTEETDYIYLWSNFDDSRYESYDSLTDDIVAREKVLMAFDVKNPWYSESKEEETELFFMCATAEQDNPKQLDINGLKDDNARADYLVGMLTASKYDFEVSCPTANISSASMSIDYYENARILDASAEPILSLGNNVNIKLSKTFIAIAIAIVIVSLLLIVYYRLSALAMIATTVGTAFITLISFASMQVLFNIPAVIGFILLSAGALFGEVVYVNRFKEEIYKGRSIKKANQEASRKSNLVTLDSVIILMFSGLMMYALGGTALKPMGVVLFFGGVFTIIMNMLVFKLLMYLVTNSTNLQSKHSLFNVDSEKVPSIMDTEEKPAYEAPYEKVDFTKKKSIISIIFGALSAAALACIIAFGVTSPTKSPLNVEKAVSDTTVVYTSIQADTDTPLISDASSYVSLVLKDTGYEKQEGIEEKVEFKSVTKYVYESDDTSKEYKYYYFTLHIDEALSETQREELEKTIDTNLDNVYESSRDTELTTVNVRNSQELNYTPDQGLVALATGIAIVGISLYFAFRFRPSRGIAALVTTTATTTIAYGAIVGMHFIGTTALTSLAMPLVAVTMMLASLFYFTTEKTMLKEGHVELTREIRNDIMVKSIGKAASPMFVFMLLSIYILINFFGFGVDNTAILFGSAIIGEIIAVVALLSIMGPLACALEKAFSKIHLPKIKWFNREKPKQVAKRNSSEPEETIFIGIND